MSVAVQVIAPPVPAPYLDGIDSLSDEVLHQMKGRKQVPRHFDAAIQGEIGRITAAIRQRRAVYEYRNRVKIVRELPPGLFD